MFKYDTVNNFKLLIKKKKWGKKRPIEKHKNYNGTDKIFIFSIWYPASHPGCLFYCVKDLSLDGGQESRKKNEKKSSGN